MKEFRIVWAFVPTSQNPTRVSFVTAYSPENAQSILQDHIERTEGHLMSVLSIEVAPYIPRGQIK
jgi:hypothetical protein